MNTADKTLKQIHNDNIKKVHNEFITELNGTNCARKIANNFDDIIKLIIKNKKIDMTGISIVATGGYASGYNAPYSDIDLLFLCRDMDTQAGQIESVLYDLWDTGAKISQSVHTVNSALNETSDHVFLTSVLKMRIVSGDEKLFNEFKNKLSEKVLSQGKSKFIEDKLSERQARHYKYGDSRYLLEPNVKNGKGGLRDMQTMLWTVSYVYDIDTFAELHELKYISKNELTMFKDSFCFLWSVRLALHFINKSANEVLTFPMQLEVASALGYKDSGNNRAVEKFMSDYISHLRTVSILTRVIMHIIETKYLSKQQPIQKIDENFQIVHGRISIDDEKLFEKNPTAIFDLFYLVATSGLKIHYTTYKAIRENNTDFSNDKYAQSKFMEILMSEMDVERTLRLINETGVLSRLIPEWKVISCQMQYNMYHSYTTDEHTVQAVGLLSQIDANVYEDEFPITTKIVKTIKNKKIIYMAVLLHDIAKGLDGDHSILGAEVAKDVCNRFGFEKGDTEMVSWLVENHLLMSNTSQRRDISDDSTIEDFTKIVNTPEKLDLLTLLTVIDTKSVGPNVWNDWKGEMLFMLYNLSLRFLATGDKELLANDIVVKKQQLESCVKDYPDISKQKFADFMAITTPQYLVNYSDTEIMWHIQNIVADDEIVIAVKDDKKGFTKLIVRCPDRTGLVADITGALSVMGANIISADVYTFDEIGSFDIIYVQDKDGGVFKKEISEIQNTITESVKGNLDIEEKILKNTSMIKSDKDNFNIMNRVNINNEASKYSTIVEVRSKDTKGLLYGITREISNLGLSIESSKITTYGERVVDVFYVKDKNGFKLQNSETESKLVENISRVLEELNNENI